MEIGEGFIDKRLKLIYERRQLKKSKEGTMRDGKRKMVSYEGNRKRRKGGARGDWEQVYREEDKRVVVEW